MVTVYAETMGQISDGYHTFDELYEHRYQLWITLCRVVKPTLQVFKTKKHSDGTMYDGWFLLMMLRNNKQLSYHLPMRLWDECDFSERESAPDYDGHTSADVLERLKDL